MFTVPVLIFALAGAISVGVGFMVGGAAVVGGAIVAAPLLGAAVRLHQRAAGTLAVGIPGGALTGVATVLSYKGIGSTIHDESMVELRLRISIPGREPYELTHWDVVGVYAASRLSTNAAFRCAVDPRAAHEVLVRWEQPVTLDGLSDPGNRLGVHTPVRTDASLSAAALLAHGLPARARIVQSSSQGTVAPNGDPILVFVLHVVPDNGTPPFQSLTAQRVPPDRLAYTVAGTPLRVAYDPENRTRMVAIDWAADGADPVDGVGSTEDVDSVGGVGPDGSVGCDTAAEPGSGDRAGAAPFVVTSTPQASG